MRVYEILFIVAPNTEEDDIQSLVTLLSDIVTNQGAQVTNVNRMGLRRLAYQIQKFREGHYVVLTVEGSGAEIAELERRMRVLDAVIRYLSIRIDEDLKRAQKFKARRAARAGAGAGGGSRSRRGGPASGSSYNQNADEEEGEEL